MSNLTPKQERFAQLYVELGTAAEAYRRAYDSQGKPAGVQVSASRLLSDPRVSLRVEEIRERIAELSIWKRIDSLSTLADIAKKGEKDSDKVAAVKAINAMHGWDKQTIDHTSSDRSMSPKTFSEMYGKPESEPS